MNPSKAWKAKLEAASFFPAKLEAASFFAIKKPIKSVCLELWVVKVEKLSKCLFEIRKKEEISKQKRKTLDQNHSIPLLRGLTFYILNLGLDSSSSQLYAISIIESIG